jgi:hypothetical protein
MKFIEIHLLIASLKSSSLKLLGQMSQNLVGNTYGSFHKAE